MLSPLNPYRLTTATIQLQIIEKTWRFRPRAPELRRQPPTHPARRGEARWFLSFAAEKRAGLQRAGQGPARQGQRL